MNDSRDIIDGLLRGRKVKRMGLYDFIWPDTVKKFVEQGMPLEDGVPIDVPTHFGWDMHRLEDWAIELLDWKPMCGYKEVIEESPDWEVYKDGAGATTKWWKEKSGTQQHIAYEMDNRQLWEDKYKPHLLEYNPRRLHIPQSVENLRKWKSRGFFTFHLHMFIWEILRQSMGDLKLYTALVEDADWIEDFNRVYTDLFKRYFAILFEKSGLPDGIWITDDLAYKGSLFCNPAILEKHFFPYYAELVGFFNSYNLPVLFHSCGYVAEVLDLVVQSGFVAINPMEIAAGNDPLQYAEKYGDKVVLVGGMDKRIIEAGDRNEIKKAVVHLTGRIKELGTRYIFASDHSLSTMVDYDDYKYTVDVFRDHCEY